MTTAGDFTARKAVEGNLLDRISLLERRLRALENRPVVVRNLEELTSDLGEQQAGSMNLDGMSFGITHTAMDNDGNVRTGRLGFFRDARGVPNWVLDYVGTGKSLNLLANPSFEDQPALVNWTPAGWNYTSASTNWRMIGSKCFYGQLEILTLNGTQVATITSDKFQVMAGVAYSGSFYVHPTGSYGMLNGNVLSMTYRSLLLFYDENDNLLETHTGPDVYGTYSMVGGSGQGSSTFDLVASGDAVAPDGAVKAAFVAWFQGVGSGGFPAGAMVYFVVDGMLAVCARRAGQFAFDGDAVFYGDYIRDNGDGLRFASIGLHIPPPTNFYAVKTSAGTVNLPVGTYQYVLTFEDNNGVETTPSPSVQVTTDSTNRAVSIALPKPHRGVYKINIYRRTGASGSFYYLFGTYPADTGCYDYGLVELDTNRTPPAVNLTRGAEQHPHRIFLNGSQGYASIGGSISRVNSTSQVLGTYWRFDGLTTQMQWVFTFHAAQGLYDFEAVGVKASGGMQCDVYMDGTKINTALIEQYAATAAYNQAYAYPDVYLAFTGWHTLAFHVTGKNASSAGYKLYLSYVSLIAADPLMP